MKRWGYFLISMVFLGIFAFVLFIYSAEEDFLKERHEEDISFLSGGVSQKAREILKEKGKEYSLKLIFSNKRGEYLSDVMVMVLNQKNDMVLTTISNGPWLFINLPSGRYHLEASFQAKQRMISKIDVQKGIQRVLSIQW